MTISRDQQSEDYPIRWAFGAGVQAITPVIERDGKLVEQRISWYKENNRLSLSPGHDPAPVFDVATAAGIEQSESNATRCFGCHTTGGSPGVTCQSCHGDSALHRKSPASQHASIDRSVALCASCHRAPDKTFASATPEMEDAQSIRFAPIGFTASRCFQKSKNFTCVTCHDPHDTKKAVSIDVVCQSCHNSRNVHAASKCPRTQNCAGCHMQAGSPLPNLRFTDHRIRVFAPYQK